MNHGEASVTAEQSSRNESVSKLPHSKNSEAFQHPHVAVYCVTVVSQVLAVGGRQKPSRTRLEKRHFHWTLSLSWMWSYSVCDKIPRVTSSSLFL